MQLEFCGHFIDSAKEDIPLHQVTAFPAVTIEVNCKMQNKLFKGSINVKNFSVSQ